MIEIIFESHGTTYDNEEKLSSGWFDVELSPLGQSQAVELGRRYSKETFDVIFCSDLKRSLKTAEIAFAGRKFPIFKDKRLRECDYGDLTRHPSKEVEPIKEKCISTPFPNGESYEQTSERMKNFLADLLRDYNGKKVMIIGHRATQYGLECLINNVSLKDAVISPWQWQPGWKYTLKK